MTALHHERELFRFRPSLAAGFTNDTTGTYRFGLIFDLAPWRGIALGLALSIGASVVLPSLIANDLAFVLSLCGLLGVSIALEALFQRDFLTTTAVVRQRGIFGTHRTVILLEDIQRVEYPYPPWGKHLDVGDVLITTTGGGALLRGLSRPASVAQLILDAKARSLRTDVTPSNDV